MSFLLLFSPRQHLQRVFSVMNSKRQDKINKASSNLIKKALIIYIKLKYRYAATLIIIPQKLLKLIENMLLGKNIQAK